MTFTKGVFLTYRAVTQFHLGAINEVITKDELLEFDGTSLQRNGTTHQIPSLRGAIKAGWLVPGEDVTTQGYKPKSAEVQMGKAVTRGENREMLSPLRVVAQDQNQVHTTKPTVKVATPTSQNNQTSDGIIIGRLNSPAKAPPVELGVGDADRRIVNDLENKRRVIFEKTATGDVKETLVGDNLEDILPEAVSSGVPVAKVHTDSDVTTSSGSTSIGSSEDGLVVKKIPTLNSTQSNVSDTRFDITTRLSSLEEQTSLLNTRIVECETRLNEVFTLIQDVSNHLNELNGLVFNSYSPHLAQESDIDDFFEPLQVQIEETKDFTWSVEGNWKTRLKNAKLLYGDNPEILARIKAVEINAVVRGIEEFERNQSSSKAA